ncbi:MAG: hypothetical protein GY749_48180 [Desulfobacteraceae bacterium]|nr:hypothetical protein [Desulfobacteraceae bacterium]
MKITSIAIIAGFFAFLSLMCVFSDLFNAGNSNNMTVFICFVGCAGMAAVIGIIAMAIMVNAYDIGLIDGRNSRRINDTDDIVHVQKQPPVYVQPPPLPMNRHIVNDHEAAAYQAAMEHHQLLISHYRG